MVKKYVIDGLDCAHCAAKIEKCVNKIKGVNSSSANFLFQKITIDFDENMIIEPDKVFESAINGISKEYKVIL